MSKAAMWIYHGSDKSGIVRVMRDGSTPQEAYHNCRQAVIDYVRGRPETGPVETWLIEEH